MISIIGPRGTEQVSEEEFHRRMAESRAAADADVDDAKRLWAAPGACFVRWEPEFGVLIYGEIIEPKYEEDCELYAQPHMRNVRLCRCYSTLEPDGEYGNVHIAVMHAFISRKAFDAAKLAGWPNTPVT